MVNYLFDVARAVFAAIVILFFLMLPEMILGGVYPSFAPCWDPVRLGILLALALSLSLVKSKKFLTCFLLVFSVLQLLQFGVVMSAGRYVSPFEWDSFAWAGFVSSIKDSAWYRCLALFGMVLVPYLILEYIFARGILNPPAFKKGWIATILFLAVFVGYTVSPERKTETQTACSCYASYNTLNVSAFYLADTLPQKIKEKWPDVSFAGLSAQAAEE
ncbi:MAG: hypothetical protein J5787_00355 [Alphaproteobacteria bacterium]|nr:hypothetical protein [Alphaproteobacteria bacterium]